MSETSTPANLSDAQRFPIGSDPKLSALVRKELLATLSVRAKVNPDDAERALEARDARAEFNTLLGDVGLTPDSLPDLLAGHLIAMWTVVHDAPLPDRELALALAAQFRSMLAGSPQAADPAKRQMMGEALLHEAVLTLDAQREARSTGNTTLLKEMAESAQRNLLAQRSINLRKTRFTRSGMVRT